MSFWGNFLLNRNSLDDGMDPFKVDVRQLLEECDG